MLLSHSSTGNCIHLFHTAVCTALSHTHSVARPAPNPKVRQTFKRLGIDGVMLIEVRAADLERDLRIDDKRFRGKLIHSIETLKDLWDIKDMEDSMSFDNDDESSFAMESEEDEEEDEGGGQGSRRGGGGGRGGGRGGKAGVDITMDDDEDDNDDEEIDPHTWVPGERAGAGNGGNGAGAGMGAGRSSAQAPRGRPPVGSGNGGGGNGVSGRGGNREGSREWGSRGP